MRDREALRAARSGRCPLCTLPVTNVHHIYPRSKGGDDVPPNLVGLCGSGTTGCHGLIELRDPAARSALGAMIRSQENRMSYLERKIGDRERAEAWLNRNYPTAT